MNENTYSNYAPIVIGTVKITALRDEDGDVTLYISTDVEGVSLDAVIDSTRFMTVHAQRAKEALVSYGEAELRYGEAEG
jgi:hypothetical protein